MKIIRIFIITTLIILACCGREKPSWRGTIKEINGVVFVKNPKTPLYTDKIIDFTEDLRIGSEDGPSEYIFTDIRGIAVNDDENIYVGDYRESHIKVFDKKGKFIQTIGKRGQGPGEIARINFIQITGNNDLMVFDQTSRRIHHYSQDGEFLRAIPIKHPFISLRFDTKEYFYGKVSVNSPKNRTIELIKTDSDFTKIDTIAKVPITLIGQPMLIFDQEIYFQMRYDRCLVYGNSEDYEITIKSPDGRILKRISKAYKPVPITRSDKKRIRKETRKEVGPDEKVNFTAHFPAFWSFTIDDQGRIFVRTCSEADWTGYLDKWPERANTYDIFDPEGKFIGKFSAEFFPRIWKKGKLYTIEVDEKGFQYVKRYQVDWKID